MGSVFLAGVSFAGSTSGPGQRVGDAFFDRGSGWSRRRGLVPREARFLWLYQFGDESGTEVENDGATRNRKPGGDATLRGCPLQPIGAALEERSRRSSSNTPQAEQATCPGVIAKQRSRVRKRFTEIANDLQVLSPNSNGPICLFSASQKTLRA